MIARNAKKSPKVTEEATTEWIEQVWREKNRSGDLPTSIGSMLKTGKKYNIKISVLRAPMELKLNMPAFFHPGANPRGMYNNSKYAECQRHNHKVKQIRDACTLQRETQTREILGNAR